MYVERYKEVILSVDSEVEAGNLERAVRRLEAFVRWCAAPDDELLALLEDEALVD